MNNPVKYDLSGTSLEIAFETKDSQMVFLKRKLDSDIGYNYWKKYVASAFWAQISTPINLCITFLTAITTAQAQTQELISQSVFSQIAIVSLIITTLNTFFRPHTQYSSNTEYLGKWNDIGVRFEKEYCHKLNTRIPTNELLLELDKKIEKYNQLQDEVTDLRKVEGAGTVNFLTDLIFFVAYSTCIRNHKKWLDLDKKIMKEIEARSKAHKDEIKRIAHQEEIEVRERDSSLRLDLARIEMKEREILEKIKQMEEGRQVKNIVLENTIEMTESASRTASEASGIQDMTPKPS